jgi:universal stress protein E
MTSAHWKTIVVVISKPFADEQPALVKAAAVARRSGARLLLFNCFMLPPSPGDAAAASQAQILAAATRERRERLHDLVRKFRLRDLRCVVHWDYPAHEAIVRQVLKAKADLLITDSHRHGRLARLLLANTDWELMRICPCPMWFVRSAALPRSSNVLVAVDPRHAHAKPARLDEKLLQTAAALTHQLGGRLSMVHAYERTADIRPGLLRRPLVAPPESTAARQLTEQTTRSLAALGIKYGVPASDCNIRAGQPREIIATEARRRDTDVLVMGAVSRNPSIQPAIGGTAEVVIDQVTCDVLVVKPAGFRSPVQRRVVRGQTTRRPRKLPERSDGHM